MVTGNPSAVPGKVLIMSGLTPVCCLAVTRSRSVALLISHCAMAQQLGLEASLAGVRQGIIYITDAR